MIFKGIYNIISKKHRERQREKERKSLKNKHCKRNLIVMVAATNVASIILQNLCCIWQELCAV